MKTAISVPDETFQRVERRAAELGVSRSQFYATAAARYLEDLERTSLTAKINEALELAGQKTPSGEFPTTSWQRSPKCYDSSSDSDSSRRLAQRFRWVTAGRSRPAAGPDGGRLHAVLARLRR